MWSVPVDGGEETGSRGSVEQFAAIMMLCTGNMNTCSFGEDFDEEMASTWVGYVGCAAEEEDRNGMESTCGTCDLGMVLGRCDDGKAEMPASILRRVRL